MDNKGVIYSNAFEISSTIAEMRIVFGLETPLKSSDGKIKESETDQIVDVRMSYFIAKQLYSALGDVIEHYEKSFGAVNVGNNK